MFNRTDAFLRGTRSNKSPESMNSSAGHRSGSFELPTSSLSAGQHQVPSIVQPIPKDELRTACGQPCVQQSSVDLSASKSTSSTFTRTENSLPAVSSSSSTLTSVSSNTAFSGLSQVNQHKHKRTIQYVGIQGVDKALLSENYYHGIVHREEVNMRLEKDGDFLLCISEDTSSNQAVVMLAVKFASKVRFLVIGKTKKGRFYITEKCFDSIPLLVEHYTSTREALNAQLPIVIKRPISLPAFIITHDRIRLGEQIGKGAFGKVFKATLVCGLSFQVVAVKMFKDKKTHDLKQRALFLQEARTMREYKHDNIVNFIGIASQQEPLMLVLEYCANGCLLNHLRTNGSTLNVSTRFRFATEAASGLRYLEAHKCIHRDIAARNCLLDERMTCKISDFGLSIKKHDFDNKTVDESNNRLLPVKWLAPEVLRYRQFSNKSDVWAYGSLLLIFGLISPFRNFFIRDLYGRFRALSNTTQIRSNLMGTGKFRMELPLDIPPTIVSIIQTCWEEDPAKRPTFKDIHKRLHSVKF